LSCVLIELEGSFAFSYWQYYISVIVCMQCLPPPPKLF
jgi:hypothetical protein